MSDVSNRPHDAVSDARPSECPKAAICRTRAALMEGRADVDTAGDPRDVEESRRRHRERRLIGYSRFMAVVPSVGLFIASMALTLSTLFSTVKVTFEAVVGRVDMQDMLVDYIEFADYFLLAVVLYIMSVGLYSLFVDDGINMPSWLRIHDLDDLKEKLVGVIVVVMGVYFLGLLIHGTEPLDLLLMGIGIGAVVFSLAYFVRFVMVASHKGD